MAVLTVASPGPGVMMTLDNAVTVGWRAAMHGVVGLALGAAIMATLSSAGIGVLVRSSAMLFLALKYCGALYLAYLAWKAWRRPTRAFDFGANGGDPAPQPVTGGGERRLLLFKGALLQTSNPKSLLFFLSVLPQVAQAQGGSAPVLMRVAAGIATYCLTLMVVHGAYAALAVRARRWLARPSVALLLSRASAVVYLAFGAAMLAF